MRNILIVLGISIAAIVVGAGLYFLGPKEFHELPPEEATVTDSAPVSGAAVPFTVIDSGPVAGNMPEPKNYAIYDQEEFERLWNSVHVAGDMAAPSIDFSERFVLAVFAGTKATGGHSVSITNITDTSATRMVAIQQNVPGAGCISSQSLTSPYQIVTVPLSDHTLSHTETVVEMACP